MSFLNESSNVLMGWWPVIVSLWGIVTFVLGLYARLINLRLQGAKDDLTDVRGDLTTAVTKLDTLEARFQAYQLDILRTYMPTSEIKEMVADLKAFLIRIEDKVDGRKAQ